MSETSDPGGVGESRVEESGASAPDKERYAVSTYRYLRLAIVTVVMALAVSLVLERAHATCWNGSISSYYYTPVHSIFIAALGVIGVALFAIRGGTLAEEVLLNMAAFLAPVVAFVPTGWSSADCPSNLTDTSKATIDSLLNGNGFFAKFSSNNLVVFVIGSLMGLILAATLAFIRDRRPTNAGGGIGPAAKELIVPALGSVLIVVVGYIWHHVWPAAFNTHAHGYAAVLMFGLVAVVMVSTAEREETTLYKRIYFACPSAMALGGVAVVAMEQLATWHHAVLVLELIELTGFVVFWFVQTIQLWDAGLCAPGTSDEPLRSLSRRQWQRVVPG